MLALIVLTLSSWGLGYGTLRLFRIPHTTDLSFIGITAATVLGVWCVLLFFLGHAHLFIRPFLIVLSSIFAAVSLVIFILKRPVSLKKYGPDSGITLLIKFFYAGSAAILFLSFLACFAPVTGGISNDEVSCHLFIPKLWLSQGNMGILPYLTSYQAGGCDLLFLLAGCFSPGPGQRLVSWLALVLCLAVLYDICRPRLGKKSAIICVTIAVMNPLIFRTASVAFTDMTSALFVLLGLRALLEFEQSGHKKYLWLMALYAGMGIAIKPTNAIYSACLMAASAVLAFHATPFRSAAKSVIIAACIACCIGALWPIRSLLLTGSPVFPPPLQVYEHRDIKPLLALEKPFSQQDIKAFYTHVLARYSGYKRDIFHLIRFPWDFTMHPGKFQAGDSLGAVLLALLPLLVFLLPLQRWIWYIVGLACSASTLLYAFVLPEARYYIPAYMALCIPAALVVDKLAAWTATRRAVECVLCCNLIFACAVAIRIYDKPIRAVFDQKTRDQYRGSRTPFFEAFAYLEAMRASLVVIPRPNEMSYYLTAQCIIDQDIENRAAQYPEAYILDMDYSQALKRDPQHRAHEYALAGTPAGARLVFEGSDARIYKVTKL